MGNSDLQTCITECESALSHLNKALANAQADSKPKMQHAAQDLEECVTACRNLL